MKTIEKYKILLLIIILLSVIYLLSTCSKVDRVNPYDDKANLSPNEWAPKNLTIVDVSITEKKLTWTYEDKQIEGIKLERRINNGAWESPFPIFTKDLKSFNDTTVLPDTSLLYEYRLYAIAGNNQSAQSSLTSKANFPAPTDFKTEKVTDVTYNLSWKDNCIGEDGYRIDRRIDGNEWQIGFRNLAVNQISITDSNVFRSMAIEYRVYAYYKIYESEKTVINTTCDLPAPSGLQIFAESPTTARLTWQDNSNGEDGFRIGRQANDNYFEIIANVPGNTVSYLDTSFSLNTTMHYWIWALSGQYASPEIESYISPPVINTYDVSALGTNFSLCGGIISGTNFPDITERGICYGISTNPTISDSYLSAGAGDGSFFIELTGLTDNTMYFYKAYTKTIAGTFYGDEKSFTTLQITMPTVVTTSVLNITQTTATIGGNITSDGGAAVIARGVCWSTNPDPDLTDSHTSDGYGIGEFNSNLSGLSLGTLYYVRAYATNNVGTSYGNLIRFYSTFQFGISIVIVEGGSFVMGCTFEQVNGCNGDELPAHSVYLDSFTIMATEITQQQWFEIMGSNPSNFSGCDACPVETVSLDEVLQFIVVLNQFTGFNFRLPTEAEWEFAARGGNSSLSYEYSGSNSLIEVGWWSGVSGSQTNQVALRNPNELGLFDMSGNVWEWCSDWYAADYYTNSPTENPQGPASGVSRIVRGGSWTADHFDCRNPRRFNYTPATKLSDVGFRLVLEF